MKNYIALLRGINVSGKNKILMADLRLLLEGLGFENVQTYIQSGNVIFQTNKKKASLSKLIATKINETYNYNISVIIIDKLELQSVIKNNPFLINDTAVDLKKLYVFYLNKIPKETQKLTDFDFGKDEYIIVDKVIYIKYNLGAGTTKLSIKIIENKLDVIATARNWRSTNKIYEMIDAIS